MQSLWVHGDMDGTLIFVREVSYTHQKHPCEAYRIDEISYLKLRLPNVAFWQYVLASELSMVYRATLGVVADSLVSFAEMPLTSP